MLPYIDFCWPQGHPQKRISRRPSTGSGGKFQAVVPSSFPAPELPSEVAGRVQCNCAEQAHKVWAAAYWSQVQQCRGHVNMKKEIELNIGLLVEATGKEISRGVASAALAATGFEAHASILHISEWEGKPQPTLVVVGFAPSNGWHAHNLAVVLEQDSIAVLDCDAGHGRLDGRNPQGYAFDHAQFVTFEQALEAELERRKLAALEDLEHARLFEAAVQPA